MTKKPSYRFADYTEPWADKKLGELVERVTRKNKNLESDLPLTISAQYGLIDQQTFFNKKVASKDVSGYYLLKKGEFAYNKSYSSDYPWGAVKRLDNYEMGVLSTLYIVFRPNSIDSDFLAVYYDSPKWYKEVSMRAAEGARNHGLLNISPQDFFDTELIFPVNQSEQTAIGSFFQDIDQLISLQQRKLDVLKEQKKTYLKLLFPAKGQTKPALRFAGFEDEWKEVKLGEVCEIYDGTHQTPIYTTEGVMFLSVENIRTLNSDKYISKDSFDKDFKISPKSGDVLMTRIGDIGTSNLVETDIDLAYYVSLALIRSSAIESKFLNVSISSDYFQKELWKRILHIAFPKKINKNEIGQSKFYYPSLPEQEVIGSFFQDLDKAIAKQEEKVNQLKESKQTLLRKMFI